MANLISDLTYSPSSVGTYTSCPEKFRLAKIEKVEVEVEEDLNLTFGSLQHKAFETFFKTGSIEQARNLDLELFSSFDNPEFTRRDVNELFNQGLGQASKLGVSLDPKEFYQYEVELESGERGIGILDPVAKVRLYLKIDLVATTTEGKKIIIDWKTTTWPYDDHRITAAQQLDMYAWAYRVMKGHYPDKVAFITLSKRDLIAESFVRKVKESQVQETINKVSAIAQQVQRGVFYKNEDACTTRRGGKLYHCPFYPICWPNREVQVNRYELPTFGR